MWKRYFMHVFSLLFMYFLCLSVSIYLSMFFLLSVCLLSVTPSHHLPHTALNTSSPTHSKTLSFTFFPHHLLSFYILSIILTGVFLPPPLPVPALLCPGRSSGWDEYEAGKFLPCSSPAHHACLDQYLPDGNLRLLPPCVA